MSSSPVLDLDRDWERDAFLDLFGLAGFDVLVRDLDRDSPLAFVLCSLCSEGHSSSSSSESSELSHLGPGGGCLGVSFQGFLLRVLMEARGRAWGFSLLLHSLSPVKCSPPQESQMGRHSWSAWGSFVPHVRQTGRSGCGHTSVRCPVCRHALQN